MCCLGWKINAIPLSISQWFTIREVVNMLEREGRRNANATMDVQNYETGQDKK